MRGCRESRKAERPENQRPLGDTMRPPAATSPRIASPKPSRRRLQRPPSREQETLRCRARPCNHREHSAEVADPEPEGWQSNRGPSRRADGKGYGGSVTERDPDQTIELRSDPRLEISIPIEIQVEVQPTNEEPIRGATENISRNGMLARLNGHVQENVPCKVRFLNPRDIEPGELHGMVRRVGKSRFGYSVAIEFDEPVRFKISWAPFTAQNEAP